jgi:hypothetical protein
MIIAAVTSVTVTTLTVTSVTVTTSTVTKVTVTNAIVTRVAVTLSRTNQATINKVTMAFLTIIDTRVEYYMVMIVGTLMLDIREHFI